VGCCLIHRHDLYHDLLFPLHMGCRSDHHHDHGLCRGIMPSFMVVSSTTMTLTTTIVACQCIGDIHHVGVASSLLRQIYLEQVYASLKIGPAESRGGPNLALC
jgi:hypothetical protein